MTTGRPERNWYEMLGLNPGASSEEIAAATERLARQAASLATTAPERSQQLRDMVRTIRSDLLAGQEARARYDARVAAVPPPQSSLPHAERPVVPATQVHSRPPHPTLSTTAVPGSATAPSSSPTRGSGIIDSVVNGLVPAASRFRRFLQAGWTCPSCGADGGPADKFCSKCGGAMATPRAPAAARCAGCAGPLADGDRFCARCGRSVH